MAADNPKDKTPWSREERLSLFKEMEELSKNTEMIHREREPLCRNITQEGLVLSKSVFTG